VLQWLPWKPQKKNKDFLWKLLDLWIFEPDIKVTIVIILTLPRIHIHESCTFIPKLPCTPGCYHGNHGNTLGCNFKSMWTSTPMMTVCLSLVHTLLTLFRWILHWMLLLVPQNLQYAHGKNGVAFLTVLGGYCSCTIQKSNVLKCRGK